MSEGSLAALVVLGAFHGLNPAMGWLFAVARGLRERSRALVLQSLPAIAAGHAASVGVFAVLIAAAGSVVAAQAVAIGGGAVLVGFGLWRLLSRHRFRLTGLRVSLPQLAGWSFLMASMHGAGLMLLPVITAPGTAAPPPPGHDHGLSSPAGGVLSTAVFVTGVHTLAMFAVAGVIALLVYELVGLAAVRRRWFDLDRVWAFTLIGAGAFTLFTAL